ncbi:MAG: SDR family oxidoreductase [Acidimicrobiaceae bacterium]|nr:SDR family oxidoreductase [Acidimicrobiaceae bacterium]MDE0665180.1 SDR family oxidoreductase [Acidimicrobiaceae bacterium]MXY11020.1 SDR family oxidoreductase [Acidimicrobiaceae bacterium]MXZ64616.1 SDR family oxidoreductase [Acidimicrobiaceae bacterium]MYF34653.1 SDR family oxidoreductase [Acidimicrobiaceae bacterium]
MAERFAGRTAIVTGAATGGLGAAYAEALAAGGARVAVADIRGAQAEATAERIEAAGGEALPIEVDITDESSVDAMVSATVERFGGVDMLINNAAVMFRFLDEPRTPFWEVPVEEFELVQRVNVIGSWLCAKAVFPHMRDRGGGKIVNISSNMALGTDLMWPAQMAAYTTSKAGVIGLTRALAGEAGPYGVTVNAVAPGVTNTETVGEHIAPDRMEAVAQSQALRRQAWPEDIVGTVMFLCSSDSDFMTGQVLCVDGGFVAN